MSQNSPINPKVFISYSWASPARQDWVLSLATKLREDGVDVSLDKWDLKEGHDALAFMEQTVSDAAVTKVIIVSDKSYAEKADTRAGGVGTETQIISPEVYAKAQQDKFCAVVSEVDAEGRPYLPTYYRSRIYIDLSNEDAYAANYDQLLRWIFGRPTHPKPALGRPPSFVADDSPVTIPVDTRYRRAVEATKQNVSNSIGALNDYLDTLSSSFESLRLDQKAHVLDDEVVRSIEAFLPYRNQYIEVLRAISQSSGNESQIEAIQRFFERLAPFLSVPPKGVQSWSSWWFDNYRFIISELFLYTVSLLLRYERFAYVGVLLNSKYYLEEEAKYGREVMQSFSALWQQVDSLDARNQRLGLRKVSLRAAILEQRSHSSGLEFRYLMQGDFTLFLQDARLALQSQRYARWWPETLIYFDRYRAPFEIYARAESLRYFEKLKLLFGIQSKKDLEPLVAAFKARQLGLPGANAYAAPDPLALMNYERLASAP